MKKNTTNLIVGFSRIIYKTQNCINNLNWKRRVNKKYPSITNEIEKNKRYNNIHRGEECYIVASGPSLKKVDLSKLKGKIVFTINQIARNQQYIDGEFDSNYHIWSDARFFEIDENKEEDLEMLDVIKGVVTKSSNPECFFRPSMRETIERFEINKVVNTNYYYGESNFFKGYSKRIDFSKVVPAFSTVVHYAICLAVYMGFEKINLLGCDCTGIITVINAKSGEVERENQYFYKMTDNEIKRFNRAANRYDIIAETKAYLSLLENYKYLDDYCRENGVQLINMSGGGVLDFITCDSFK